MSVYRFHQNTKDGWQFVGWDAADGEKPAQEAFDRLVKERELPPGEYRYHRSDRNDSPDRGSLTLVKGGEVVWGA
jgi:hypothetical protein